MVRKNVFALRTEDPGFDPQTNHMENVLLDSKRKEGQNLYQLKHENQFAVVTPEDDIPKGL